MCHPPYSHVDILSTFLHVLRFILIALSICRINALTRSGNNLIIL